MVHWDDRGEAFRLEASLPAGTSATVSIPPGVGGVLTVDGRKPSDCPGVLAYDDGPTPTIRLGSGAYVIVVAREREPR